MPLNGHFRHACVTRDIERAQGMQGGIPDIRFIYLDARPVLGRFVEYV